MGEKPQAIDFSKRQTSATEGATSSPETEITFLEFAVGQEWNSRYFTLKIKEVTKSGRYRVYMNDRASGVSELSDPMDTEALKALILEKGLRLISSGEPVAPKQEESAPVVVDLDAERLARGGEAVSPDIEADNVARQELARIDGEATDTEQRISTTVKEIMTLLADAEESDAKHTLQQEVLRISEKVPQILAETESVEQDGMKLTEKLGGRQRLLANLQALKLEAALLLDQVRQALTGSSGDGSNEPVSSADSTTDSTGSENTQPKRGGKGGGSGNGGDGEEPPIPPSDDETRQAAARERLAKMSEADQKALALLLESTEGPEIAKKIEDILIKRWDDFVTEMKQTARDKKAFIKDKDIAFLWRQYVYKEIQDLIVRYLVKNTQLKQYQAKSILRAINQKLKQGEGDNQAEEE